MNTTDTGVKVQRNDKDASEPFRGWHRNWSSGLYCTDVDLVEYAYTSTQKPKAVGLFEYKHADDKPVDEEHHQLTILAHNATTSKVPAFFVRYNNSRCFYVWPLNRYAERFVQHSGESFSEHTYERFLCSLREDVVEKDRMPEPTRGLSRAVSMDWPNDRPPFVE